MSKALIDNLLQEWASSADFPDLVERINSQKFQGYDLEFAFSWDVDSAISSGGTPSENSGFVVSDVESQTSDSEKQSVLMGLAQLKVLEVFNATNFIDVNVLSQSSVTDEATFTVSNGRVNSNGIGRIFGSKIYITEEHLGLNVTQSDLIAQSYHALRESVYKELLLETRLKSAVDSVTFDIVNGEIVADFSGLNDFFRSSVSENKTQVLSDYLEFTSLFYDDFNALGWEIDFDWLSPIWNNLSIDEINQIALNNYISVENGIVSFPVNDDSHIFLGASSADTISLIDKNDIVYTGDGSDTINLNDFY